MDTFSNPCGGLYPFGVLTLLGSPNLRNNISLLVVILIKSPLHKSQEEENEAQTGGKLVLINGTELQSRMLDETSGNVTNRTTPGICSGIKHCIKFISR